VAARAIQSGALDYLVKGEYSMASLPPLVEKAVRLRAMQRAMQQYLEQIRYQAMLLDNMRDAVVVWGMDGVITYWNAAAEQLYGADAGQRLGQRVQDVYFPFFDPHLPPPGLDQPGHRQLEHRYILPGGEKIWVSAHITPLYNESDRETPTGYMNVARDITPRKQEQEALVKSQHFIKRILDTSPNIIYILDLRSERIRYVNPEFKAILGYSVEEFLNTPFQHFRALIHTDDLPRMAQHLQELKSMKDGQPQEIEFRMMSQKNQLRWLKSRETVFSRGENGAPAEIIGVIQDITTSKLAEEKIQRRLNSEIMLSKISNYFINLARPEIDKGIATAVQMVAEFIEVECGAMFLVEPGEPEKEPCFRRSGAEAQPLLPESFCIGANTPLLHDLMRQEIVVLGENGLPEELPHTIGLSSLILIPMVYNGDLSGLLVFGAAARALRWHDEDDAHVLKTFGEMMTSALMQKEVDQALRKSEARYRAIVDDHQTEMICRFLPDATLTFVNEAYCKTYAKERADLVATSFLDPVYEEERGQLRERLAALSPDEPVQSFELRVRLPGGEARWQEWVSRAIFDQHNDFIEYQAVGRDITERKKMEEQVRTAQTHLTQAARLTSIGELASGVAHQISNPLTTIIADAQILSSQLPPSDPARESAEAILQAGWRAQQVINELMKFAQPAQASSEPVSVNETIENALLLASAHIQAFGVRLEVDLQPDLPEIAANPRHLTDLWVNLLLLARSAFQDGGEHRIRIASRLADEKTVQVEVSDDGTPIPNDQYETIFEPQLIPTGSGRGSGIELSICQEIVRQNRGNIAISGNGKDTSFFITFCTEGP
jgi:PAS domain S-box-containing protein